MTTAHLTTSLLVPAFAHLFLAVYNRWLLCLSDGPYKIPVHQAWLLVSAVIPTGLLVWFNSHPVVHAALSWTPTNAAGFALSGAFALLISFWAMQSLRWLAARFAPEHPPNLLEESSTQPPMPAVMPHLPRGLRRFETTGDLRLVEKDIIVPGLAPAFDGLTIAQVSDVHFGVRLELENYLLAVQELVAGLDADIVVLTGDLVDSRRNIARSVEYHAQFRGRLATFAVLGNHDYWTRPDRVLQALGRTHIRWLGGGERRTMKRAGRRLIFTGTDAPWCDSPPDLRRVVRRGTGDAVVLLSHTPDNAPAAARHGASLILSGHNHGGQVCLPVVGPVVVPSRYGLKYAAGTFRVGAESLLNVSRGIGVSEGGIRICCPPEVHLLRLHAPRVEVMVGRVITARDILRAPEADTAGGYVVGRSGVG